MRLPLLIIGCGLTVLMSVTPRAIAQECPLGWAAVPLAVDMHGADGPIHASRIVGGCFGATGSPGPNSRHIAAWNGSAWLNISVLKSAKVIARTLL